MTKCNKYLKHLKSGVAVMLSLSMALFGAVPYTYASYTSLDEDMDLHGDKYALTVAVEDVDIGDGAVIEGDALWLSTPRFSPLKTISAAAFGPD